MFQRADVSLGVDAQRSVEDCLIMFAVWLVEKLDVQCRTAKAYVSTVRAWHARRFGEMLPGYAPVRLRAVFRGMRRLAGVKVKRRRRGVRTQLLSAALRGCLGDSLDDMSIRAACEVAFCGLLRVSEYTTKGKGSVRAEKVPLVRDVSFRQEAGELVSTVRVCPSKKGERCQGKTVPLELRDGKLLQPATALWRMLRARDATPDEPLFMYRGEPLRAGMMNKMVKWLMQSVGEDPAVYGSHSLRIGGASAALAAGVPPETIRILGRWDSSVYEIYCRLSRQSASRVGAVVASTPFQDFEGEFEDEELIR